MSCFVALQSKQETWSKNHDAHAVLHRPVRLDDRGPGRAICPLAHWDDYGGAQLFRNAGQGAYVFATTHAQVDADGAPNAYHPDDVGLNCKTGTGFKGLDCPANGGYPNGDWWPSAIVPDPKNKKGLRPA